MDAAGVLGPADSELELALSVAGGAAFMVPLWWLLLLSSLLLLSESELEVFTRLRMA